MANMSYCRFQNTLPDLKDCIRAIENLEDGPAEGLSDEEAEAAEDLFAACKEYVETYNLIVNCVFE